MASVSSMVYYVLVISKLTADGDSELISNTTSVSGTDVVLSCRVTGKAEAVSTLSLTNMG